MENANEFLDMKRNGSKVVANATSMCILSPILLIVLVTMAEDSVFHVSESLATVFGCVFLLGMVAAAVFLFITYGMRESHMEHFEKECFETEYGVSGMVREKKDSYEPIFIRGTAVGVVLCILAVIPTIIAGSMERPTITVVFRRITAIHTCNRSESVGSCWDGKKQLRYPSSGRRIYKRRKTV